MTAQKCIDCKFENKWQNKSIPNNWIGFFFLIEYINKNLLCGRKRFSVSMLLSRAHDNVPLFCNVQNVVTRN